MAVDLKYLDIDTESLSFINEDDQDPLCCCEYYNIKRQRSHILSFFCECEDLDETVDNWIKGNPQKINKIVDIIDTFADRCRVPWLGGAKAFDFGCVFPPILLTNSAIIASWHYVLTAMVFLALPPIIIFCYMSSVRLKIKTRLFLSLNITSTIGCYAIYFYYVSSSQNFLINLAVAFGAIVTVILFKQCLRKDKKYHVFHCEDKESVPYRGKYCRYVELYLVIALLVNYTLLKR